MSSHLCHADPSITLQVYAHVIRDDGSFSGSIFVQAIAKQLAVGVSDLETGLTKHEGPLQVFPGSGPFE
ncbi:hypothetical protein ACWENQ_08675 [Nonomuraea sp. NPDC004354]